MTREEAIQFLDNMKHEEAGRAIGKDGFYAELLRYHVEALNMAIKAIEQTEPEKCGDCISRQAVVDHINRLIEVEKKQGTDDWGYGLERVNAYEAMLHFVKSEYLYPSVEPDKCGDCISREQAIKQCGFGMTSLLIADNLRRLPSVEPERKTGKWIDGKCNRCGTHAPFWAMASTYYCSEFCPNCGARMENG